MVGVGEIRPHVPLEAISETTMERAISSVRQFRDRLNPEFASVSDVDLAVTGVFAVIRRRDEAA
jgi:hypothetical protein